MKNSTFKVRDLRKKDQYKIDDAYLNGYARLCGVYATAVYNSLSRHADFNTQECFPSIEKIADQHNISKPSVISAIKELQKWNIISVKKEKDPKTKRQLPNVYLLLDKEEWVKKPIRVNDIDSEPSKPDDKSRVNHIDCKDNTYKKDNTSSEHSSQEVTTIISLFEIINPTCKAYYANTTQRGACQFLLDTYGFEKVSRIIKEVLPKTNGREYFPTITTPAQLKDKWASLEANYRSYINKQKAKQEHVYW